MAASRSQRSGKSDDIRDVQADYLAAYIEEHASYKAAGRDEDAAKVAQILRDHFDYDVDAEDAQGDEPGPGGNEPEGAPETTAAAAPPEAAVEQKPTAPKAGAQRRTAAKKPAAAKEA